MYEVENKGKDLASRLIQSYSDMSFAGIVAGNNAGRVWVDNLDNPSSALVWSDGLEGFQFIGSANNQVFINELKIFKDTYLINFLKDKGMDCFEYSADTEEWYPIIKNALSDRDIKYNWQYVYKSVEHFRGNDKVILPKPYESHKIDRNFINSIKDENKVNNPEFLIDYIVQFWGSVGNYLKLGYGYAAVAEKKIVSFGLTSFLYEETFSIGVETLEEHRRKGLASTLVNILSKELLSKGYKLWWDCMDSNIASQKTAESTGLVLDYKYKVFWFDI